MATVYRAARIFDGRSSRVLGSGVVVEGEKQRRTSYPPVYAAMSEKGSELGAPAYIQRKTAKVLEVSRQVFVLALDVGVSVAAGTDCGVPGHPYGTLSEELELMVEAGATPIEACLSARLSPQNFSASITSWGRWNRTSGPTCWR